MGHNDHIEDLPWGSTDTYVCAECVIDPVLATLVVENTTAERCNYCDKEVPAARFDIVLERIYESISTEYADAQDISAPWIEGEWGLPEVDLWEVVGDFDPGWGNEFLEDIQNALGYDKYWVHHVQGDWAIESPSATLAIGWDRFTDQLLYKTRYLFLSEPEDEYEAGRPDYIPVSRMLEGIGDVVDSLGLTKSIHKGTTAFRVRADYRGKRFNDFDSLGVPPRELASAGRMNPAGIPYLYLSLEPNTAVAEVVHNERVPFSRAQFTISADVRVVDLTEIPTRPSLFEPHRYQERHNVYFLERFALEIAEKVSKDELEHIAYVPTQVVSEFFRHRFADDDGAVQGILFPSSKSEGGKNLTLFVSSNEEAREFLSLESVDHFSPH